MFGVRPSRRCGRDSTSPGSFKASGSVPLSLASPMPVASPASSTTTRVRCTANSRVPPRRSTGLSPTCAATAADGTHRQHWSDRGRPAGGLGFCIVESTSTGGPRTLVPPDVATCADCLREMTDPDDRRYAHPFITCTNCGPRYTVITDCPTTAPPRRWRSSRCATGAPGVPRPETVASTLKPSRARTAGRRCRGRGQALTRPDHGRGCAIDAGGIVAVKGVGGYHLACRADAAEAVAELRRRKSRPAKPFAVMVADLPAARSSPRSPTRPRRC